MPPLKLIDTLEDLRDAAVLAHTAAASAFAAAQNAVADQRADRDAASGLLIAKLAEIDTIRRQLGEDRSPADIQVLNESLRLRQIEARHRRRALLEAEAAWTLAEAKLPVASAASTAAAAQLEAARKRFEAETRDSARRSAWLLDLQGAPITDLKAAAGAILSDPDPDGPVKAAKTRIEGDIPVDLLSRARERGKAEENSATRAGDALAAAAAALYTFRQSELGTEVELEAAQKDFAAAEEAIAEVVLRGASRLEVAIGLLAGIGQSRPLSNAEKAAIAAATAAGKVAAGLEKIRDDAAADLAQKRAALEQKRLQLRAANVDANVESDMAVIDLKNEVQQLESDLLDANNDFQAAPMPGQKTHPVALDDWEAAVPDRAWANLPAFDQAMAILTGLSGINAGTLKTQLENSEDAYAKALLAADKERRTREFLSATVSGRRPDADVAAAFLDRRRLAALRGDRSI